jgi:YjbR
VSGRPDVPVHLLDALRACCLPLPEAYEEPAWTGTRWCVRGKNFAHTVMIDDGWPPAYARAAATDGPACVLTFRAAGPELDALAHAGPPFFKPVWFRDIVGLVLPDDPAAVDWDEVTELVTESYRLLAPKRLKSP